jgi:hypothetical protein
MHKPLTHTRSNTPKPPKPLRHMCRTVQATRSTPPPPHVSDPQTPTPAPTQSVTPPPTPHPDVTCVTDDHINILPLLCIIACCCQHPARAPPLLESAHLGPAALGPRCQLLRCCCPEGVTGRQQHLQTEASSLSSQKEACNHKRVSLHHDDMRVQPTHTDCNKESPALLRAD